MGNIGICPYFLNGVVYIGECQCYNLAATLPEDEPSMHMKQRGPVSVSVGLNAIYLNFDTRCLTQNFLCIPCFSIQVIFRDNSTLICLATLKIT